MGHLNHAMFVVHGPNSNHSPWRTLVRSPNIRVVQVHAYSLASIDRGIEQRHYKNGTPQTACGILSLVSLACMSPPNRTPSPTSTPAPTATATATLTVTVTLTVTLTVTVTMTLPVTLTMTLTRTLTLSGCPGVSGVCVGPATTWLESRCKGLPALPLILTTLALALILTTLALFLALQLQPPAATLTLAQTHSHKYTNTHHPNPSPMRHVKAGVRIPPSPPQPSPSPGRPGIIVSALVFLLLLAVAWPFGLSLGKKTLSP